MPPSPARLTEAIRRLPPQTILNVADLCDGHTIFQPQAVLDAGLPPSIADALTRQHRSDPRSPKTTLFAGGRPVPSMQGIYGLDLLHTLADALGVPYRECYGRGSQAAAIREALRQHFAGG